MIPGMKNFAQQAGSHGHKFFSNPDIRPEPFRHGRRLGCFKRLQRPAQIRLNFLQHLDRFFQLRFVHDLSPFRVCPPALFAKGGFMQIATGLVHAFNRKVQATLSGRAFIRRE